MGAARLSPMSDDGGGEYRALLLRLLDKIEQDVAKLFTQQGETEKTARSAFLRVEQHEDRLIDIRRDLEDHVARLREELNKVSAEAKLSTVSLAEIKGTARLSGIIGGVLASLLVGWILSLLN